MFLGGITLLTGDVWGGGSSGIFLIAFGGSNYVLHQREMIFYYINRGLMSTKGDGDFHP